MSIELCIQRVLNMRYVESKNWHRRAAKPRDWEGLVLMTRGEIDYCFSDKTVTARAGDLLLLSGSVPYWGVCRSEEVAFFVIDFSCIDTDETLRLGAPCILMHNTSPAVFSAFSEMLTAWERMPIDIDFRAKAFLYTMLGRALEGNDTPKIVTPTDEIIGYVFEHLGDPTLNVSMLCSRFFISESQLRRNMVKATGLRPNEYILRLRLELAKNQLLDGNLRIKEISEHFGFSNPYYFSKCFTEAYGLSPRAFREKYRFA